MAINISLKFLNLVAVVLLVLCPNSVSSECKCDAAEVGNRDRHESRKLKIASLASILVAGAIGVSLPLLGKRVSLLSPDNDIFFMIKAFAAGVILCTGFIHILPDAFANLTSTCLSEKPWGDFPFAGFVAMVAAIGTLMVDTFATGYYTRLHLDATKTDEENMTTGGGRQVQVHTHATHGHAHGSTLPPAHAHAHDDLIRKRVISQVLELGIVVHSVIIGISLGASQEPHTIKPLLVALSFHQFFEGMGLGGCISQAKFKSRSTAIMATFFSLTTPVGIAIGMIITNVYSENSPTALIVEGVFNSAAAGILIYMALVDLLAADFMHPKVQSSGRIQFGVNLSLLMGAGCMAVLAKWA